MVWEVPIDSQTDPDAPITSQLGKRWDGNVIAAFGGEANAPRLEDAALDTTVTTAGEQWVQNRIAASSFGDVGTYVLASWTGAGTVGIGATVAGSTLIPTNTGGATGTGTLSGTWMAMGSAEDSTQTTRTTLWLRMS